MTQNLALNQLSCDKILKTNWSKLMIRWKSNLSSHYIAIDGVEGSASCLIYNALTQHKETQCFESLCEPVFGLKRHKEENISGKVIYMYIFVAFFCTAYSIHISILRDANAYVSFI